MRGEQVFFRSTRVPSSVESLAGKNSHKDQKHGGNHLKANEGSNVGVWLEIRGIIVTLLSQNLHEFSMVAGATMRRTHEALMIVVHLVFYTRRSTGLMVSKGQGILVSCLGTTGSPHEDGRCPRRTAWMPCVKVPLSAFLFGFQLLGRDLFASLKRHCRYKWWMIPLDVVVGCAEEDSVSFSPKEKAVMGLWCCHAAVCEPREFMPVRPSYVGLGRHERSRSFSLLFGCRLESSNMLLLSHAVTTRKLPLPHIARHCLKKCRTRRTVASIPRPELVYTANAPAGYDNSATVYSNVITEQEESTILQDLKQIFRRWVPVLMI